MKREQVWRHPLAVRAVHWLVAVSGFFLVFSGMGQLPMYKRYMVDQLPGLSWASNFEITYRMHLVWAAVFGFAIVFHIVYHVLRKEFSAWPKKGDVGESVHIIKAMIKGEKEPPHEKFLAEQRLAYLAIGIVSLTLFITGLIKVYKNTGPVVLDPGFLAIVTLVHTMATPMFVLLVIAHLAAFIIKANRPLLPSMFTGKVDKAYADERHPLWDYPGKTASTGARRGSHTSPAKKTTARAS